MATAREIHRHMKGIKNIGQITKAMKMVAAARLRKRRKKQAQPPICFEDQRSIG
ncbi:MAG: F0F1 ATP synthase subunit gamma [Phascolarctobacterium faecium]